MFPPGGWLFYQPETNWNAPKHLDFNSTVVAIMNHRAGNPRFKLSTDRDQIEWELEAYTVKRLESIKGSESYILQGSVPGSPPSFRQAPVQNAGSAAGAKKIVAGIGVLLDWLGDGAKQVEQPLAESRAKTCVGCEFNKQGRLTDFFTQTASDAIKKTLEVKNDMRISTQSDDKLGVCSLCLCPVKLKVHVPIKFIDQHTSIPIRQSLPEWCWMKNEFTHK